MLFMNEYEIQDALRRVQPDTKPVLTEAVVALANLAAWTNANSDGWPYWPKPCRAAKGLQEVIQEAERAYRNGSDADVSPAALKRALAPVKAFLTRQGVDHSVLGTFQYRVVAA
jgi:hypothetical protein